MKQLTFEPIKQQAWFKQIVDNISTSKRPVDKMSIAEIYRMYSERKFLCDTCGKELGKCNFTLEDHIIHLINPLVLWSCEDCIQNDLRSGSILGMTDEPAPPKWQLDNM